MKNIEISVLTGISVIAVAGLFGTFNGFDFSSDVSNHGSEAFGMYGHAEVIARDSEGNIKAYAQSDNVITNVGRTCIMAKLVTTSNGSSCSNGQGGDMTFISFGESNAAANIDNLSLNSMVMTPAADSNPGVNNASGTGTTNGAGVGAQAIIDNTFTVSNASSSKTIWEVGLFDSADNGEIGGGHMYARSVLGSSVSVQNGDSLTIKWTITLGGA